MYKLVLLVLFSLISTTIKAAPEACGIVKIEKILSGPRHGSMVRISNAECPGNSGWVCLDPDAQNMSQEESNRMFAFLLAFHLTGKDVSVMVDRSVHSSACGGTYALMHDARTP